MYENHRNIHTENETKEGKDQTLTFEVSHHRIIIHHRYQWLQIINDVIISLWFLAGSSFLLFDSHPKFATVLFIIGSTQMLLRPLIRIIHKIHVGEIETRPTLY